MDDFFDCPDFRLEAVVLDAVVRQGGPDAVFTHADGLDPVAEQDVLHLAGRAAVLFEFDDHGVLQRRVPAVAAVVETEVQIQGQALRAGGIDQGDPPGTARRRTGGWPCAFSWCGRGCSSV